MRSALNTKSAKPGDGRRIEAQAGHVSWAAPFGEGSQLEAWDVSAQLIVSPTGREKTGYPTQKPEGVLRRVLQASSAPGARVLDFFAGSGTTGAVARTRPGRGCPGWPPGWPQWTAACR